MGKLEQRLGFWTHDDNAAKDIGEHLYYFAPVERAASPYHRQRHVKAIIDIADDGTLAGVELIDDMPPPPNGKRQHGPDLLLAELQISEAVNRAKTELIIDVRQLLEDGALGFEDRVQNALLAIRLKTAAPKSANAETHQGE